MCSGVRCLALQSGVTACGLAELLLHACRVLPKGQVPQTRHVRGSNFCHVGVVADRLPGRAIVVAVLELLAPGVIAIFAPGFLECWKRVFNRE